MRPPAPPPAPTIQTGVPLGATGFIEARGGMRTQEEPTQKRLSMGESRAQVQVEQTLDAGKLALTADVL